METIIRPFKKSDFSDWNALWQANNQGLIKDVVTHETWDRLLSSKDHVHGLGFWQDGKMAGFLHYILHPVTGFIEPACYMQDLFVAETYRRQGIARRLIWELEEIGKKDRWARIYWLAERANPAAQNLYKTLGIPIDFTLHILPTQ